MVYIKNIAKVCVVAIAGATFISLDRKSVV